MKSTGKHRAANTAPRSGAAALMIGGLVAGTVATAGAATLSSDDASKKVASAISGDLSAAVQKTPESEQAAERALAVSSMHSASLAELRDQQSADRSSARKAPKDAAGVDTLLKDSTFGGYTVETVSDTAEADAQAEADAEAAAQAEADAQAAADAEAAAEAEAEAEAAAQQRQEQTASRQQERQEPAPTQESRPEPTQREQAPAQPAEPAAPAPVAGGVVGIAQQYVGYPYVLGGTPPSSFDCSSFTWWVYKQAGIDIPRTVSGQKAAVTPVSNPQPGDLVFTNNFYHVGIYAGNGQVIEALNPGSGVTYGAPVYGGIWYGRIGG